MRILVVEDERKVAAALQEGLEGEGYAVSVAGDGELGLDLLGRQAFDLVLLDLALPRRDGVEVLASLRKGNCMTPVFILTARDAVEDRVRGLDAGADDYLVKPFANEELVARIRALLRRSGVSSERLTFANLELDLLTRDAQRGGREIELSPIEFELLEFLLRHPRQVLARGLIYQRVWGYDASLSSNSLDVFVGHLRRKLEAGGEPRLIHTVRGVGFTLRER